MAADIKRVRWTRDVYEPSDDSFLLVDALQARLERQRRRHRDVGDAETAAPAPHPPPRWPRVALEIGCGSGYVITSLALLLREAEGAEGAAAAEKEEGARQQAIPPPPPPSSSRPLLLATDVSAPALASTAETLAAHGLRPGFDVELVQGDLAEPLRRRLRGAVDLLIFNPPYVPTPDDEVVAPVLRRGPTNGGGDAGGGEGGGGGGLGIVAAAWAGGDRGRRVVDRLLPQLGELLSDEGEAFVIAVQENDPEGMIRAAVEADEERARAAAAAETETGAATAAAAAAGAAAGERQGLPRQPGDGPSERTRRAGPLKGEVVARRAADEEALCVLRFFRQEEEGERATATRTGTAGRRRRRLDGASPLP